MLEACSGAAVIRLIPFVEGVRGVSEASMHSNEQDRVRVVTCCDEDAVDKDKQGGDSIDQVSELTQEVTDPLLLDLRPDALLLRDGFIGVLSLVSCFIVRLCETDLRQERLLGR